MTMYPIHSLTSKLSGATQHLCSDLKDRGLHSIYKADYEYSYSVLRLHARANYRIIPQQIYVLPNHPCRYNYPFYL